MQSTEKLIFVADKIIDEVVDRQYSAEDAIGIFSHCLVTILVNQKDEKLKNAILYHINEAYESLTGTYG